MATITGKSNLFFVTSPRSPYKMRDEVDVLVKNFTGQRWEGNSELQAKFFESLANTDFFEGSLDGDLAFKGRDRITRGPKALGLVDLSPVISLTEAGEAYLYGNRPAEAFTRQLLKFQLPSPYHVDKDGSFSVRPYLELLRLVYELDSLSKDEIAAFVIQLINLGRYNLVKQKIIDFRNMSSKIDRSKTNYVRFFNEVFTDEILETYELIIDQGIIKTRESATASIDGFIQTKKSNHKDYADAAIRYLRETQLVSLRSSRSNRIYIPNEKKNEVEYILQDMERDPVFVYDEKLFKGYLFNGSIPTLFFDSKDKLIESIPADAIEDREQLKQLSSEKLKELRDELIRQRLEQRISTEIEKLQTYEEYNDILEIYTDIRAKNLIDAPLMMEWNTWRAFTMLDDGKITANFRFDDLGMPLSNAPGNVSDILCEYDDFNLLIEVTLSTGATQYKMEGEPVARHLGNHKKNTEKEAYCIFIATSLNDATLAHFFVLHRTNVSYYGGKSKIIPMSLTDFIQMLTLADKKSVKPTAKDINQFVLQACQLALEVEDEKSWYAGIQQLSSAWVV